MSKQKIIRAIEGEDKEEIEKELLDSFGFNYISSFAVRPDGTILVNVGIEKEWLEFELWIDYKNKRVLIYKESGDFEFLDGEFNKEELKLWS